MSRKREAQREKRHELARQLGVASAEVDEHRHLQERARVCRPVLRVVANEPNGGALRRLFAKPSHLVLALYLVDSNGARLLAACALDSGEHHLDKLTYHRPAHFVLVALDAREPEPLVKALADAALTLDGIAVGDAALAAADWEKPRAVRVGGLAAPLRGGAVSLRGVGRVAERLVLPLERSAPVVEVEL